MSDQCTLVTGGFLIRAVSRERNPHRNQQLTGETCTINLRKPGDLLLAGPCSLLDIVFVEAELCFESFDEKRRRPLELFLFKTSRQKL